MDLYIQVVENIPVNQDTTDTTKLNPAESIVKESGFLTSNEDIERLMREWSS